MVKLIRICLLIAVALSSCSKQIDENHNALEIQFATDVPLIDMNKSIQVMVENKEIFYKSGSKINLVIYNRSSYSLYFDNDAHPIMLLTSDDNLHWKEVKNAVTYAVPMDLAPEGTVLLDIENTFVRPVLDESNFTTGNNYLSLRIVVVGEVMENEMRTGEYVGAYVDAVMQP